MRTHGDPARAYQETVLEFIDEQELVRRWGSFMLSGVGRPVF